MKENKSPQIFIIIVISIILIVAFYFLYKKFMKPKPIPESEVDVQGKTITWTDDDFPLKKGASGTRVKQLQAGLNILKNENLAIDGKFGEKTLASLKEHFNVEQLSEAAYNSYIKPNINKIDEYIASQHPANKPAANAKPANNNLFSVNNNSAFIGKSVTAVKSFKGYMGKKDDDIYIMDENKPIDYISGQFVGLVQADKNGWLQCFRTNGSRVFVLKTNVKIFNS